MFAARKLATSASLASCHFGTVSRRWLSTEAMERSNTLRSEINALWRANSMVSSPISEAVHGADEVTSKGSSAAARALMDKYAVAPETARDEDVTTALGEAFDRLLLLLVPFDTPGASEYFDRLLQVAAKNDLELTIRTVQHVFARCATYSEALAVFHAMRKAGVRMNMHAYYAMLFCLQRLEEESWAVKFRDDIARNDEVDAQALQFILDGAPGQLLPENKPWLGRVVFADADPEGATTDGTRADYDALGKQWATRYGAPEPGQ